MASAESGFVREQDAGRAMPLRAWTSKQKAWLAERVHGAQQDWCHRWGLQAPALDEVVVGEPPWDNSSSDEHLGLDALMQRMEIALGAALFADEDPSWSAVSTPGVLAKSVTQKALDAWRKTVGSELEMSQSVPAGPAAAAAHALDGRIHIRMPFAQTPLQFSISADRIQKLLVGMEPERPAAMPSQGQNTALTSVMQALQNHSVHLQVHLTPATLTLGELHALQPGDVITLEHKLSDPLAVHTPDGGLLGRAWLGQAGGHVAVRLQPSASAPTTPYAPVHR